MTTQRPRIAIPEPTSSDQAYNERGLPQYIRAIEAAGGTAVTIPLHDPIEMQAALAGTCAGIVLPGSPADVDPLRYGQIPVEACAEKDAARELTDILLLRYAFESHKPLLGICFGLQSLNVWRQGTLVQDLPKADGSPSGHVNHQPGREVLDAHGVTINPDSRLAQLILDSGEDSAPFTLRVNSSHHQAVDQPGELLTIAARSDQDGVIEALEIADPERFMLAVQWHPERNYESSPASRALFSAFMGAVRATESAQAGGQLKYSPILD